MNISSSPVALPWIVLEVVINKPFKRGFFCNDESIKHPYLKNTVDYRIMVGVSVAAAFVLVTVCEAVLNHTRQEAPFEVTDSRSIPHFFLEIYRFYGIFIFGIFIQQSVVNIGKYTIGRLRPHFLTVCNPDYSKINCTLSNSSETIFAYVENFECSVREEKITDSRLSFPSGHSCYAAYVAVYFIIYLQSRWTHRMTALLKHTCQAVLANTAVFVCLSRISDYKHHPTDVLAGSLLGFIIGALMGMNVTKLFTMKSIVRRLQSNHPHPIYATNVPVASKM
ncbi:hypothetical protein HELRODRAFT_116983 [Helobdella robusta]|uniref:Phosphatidic acid phosphatase type 2/haloperoxidase domain-containing protein n=1 Tax=Helobdella robusta TaxID=6412 RepID=T1EGJ1_HELRO|nr:hypothetical protein HELRODRAFT_116983 [Helobdella robusta]ESO10397.1 hypothetical protein HELRODRAFT_116983 [Helobdella robusta]